MSDFSDEEEKELINFESLEILDLFEHYSEIYAAECIDINSGKIKNILIKTNESKKNFDDKSNSTYSKNQNSNPNKEEISELKYSLYLGLIRDCVPEIKKCAKIMKSRDLIGHRVIIQPIEIREEQKHFLQKKYIFIPPTEETEFYVKIDENNSLKVTKGKNVTMQLGTGFGVDFKKEKDLKKLDENTEQDIANIIVMKTKSKISENNKIKQNEIIKNEGSDNINTEIETNSEESISKKSVITNESELSKFDTSSENELAQGELFYEEKENGTKYIRYSYFNDFKKEIDGIFYSHSGIKLNKGKKELNLNEYKSYEDFLNKYNEADKNNDLHGYIIMKNFEEEIIDKDTPFIIEIKRGFELIKLLKQIKKSAKYVNNLQNFNDKLPKYIIGIICSFSNNKNNVMNQLGELNKKYDGTNNEHKSSQINFLTHITKIIAGENINFALAVIKDGIINKYNLKKNDYDINYANKNNKRVDLMHMYKTINNIDKLNQEDEEKIEKKISNVIQNFSTVFNTFNNEKTIELSVSRYNQIIKQEKENKELKEKLETYEKIGDNLVKEKNKIREEEEERKRIQEDELKKIQEEIEEKRKKIEEERKRIQEERKRIQEEERKRKQEEERKRIQEEERKRIQEEELKKIQEEIEEKRKKIEEERKRIQEEERKKIQKEERERIQEEERKKIQEEERQKIQEEERKRIQEERKRIQEEERKRIQEEERKKIQEEERKRIQEEIEEKKKKMEEEERKRIQEEERERIQEEEKNKIREEERKRMQEEMEERRKKTEEKNEKKGKEDRSKNEQAPENHEEKNIRKPKNI